MNKDAATVPWFDLAVLAAWGAAAGAGALLLERRRVRR